MIQSITPVPLQSRKQKYWNITRYEFLTILDPIQKLQKNTIISESKSKKAFMLVYKASGDLYYYSKEMTELAKVGAPGLKINFDVENLKFTAETKFGNFESSNVITLILEK